MRIALVTTGIAIALIVVRDGSPPWRLARLVATVAVTGIALMVFRRGDRAHAAGAAFVAGLVGTSIGVGIGVPHLAKAGVNPMTIAGLLCLAGGLALLVAGGALLTLMTPRWRRVVVVPLLLFSVVIFVFTLGQAVAATNVAPTSVGVTTPRDRGVDYEDVEFETGDGVTLSGWYLPSANGAAVVLLHGAGSTRANVLDHAVVLARHGYGVLLFDGRGHGRSGGRAMDFGWWGDEDIAGAVSFLQTRSDVDDQRIAAVGMSMGGEEAIGAAASDPRIRAVVAEGATNRVAGDKAWLSAEFGWRGGLQRGIEWLVYNTADLLTDADQPMVLRDAVSAAAPRPVLLIAAGAIDEEERAGRFIQAGSPDTVELWVAPESGHTDALDTNPEEWDQRVSEFLAIALAT